MSTEPGITVHWSPRGTFNNKIQWFLGSLPKCTHTRVCSCLLGLWENVQENVERCIQESERAVPSHLGCPSYLAVWLLTLFLPHRVGHFHTSKTPGFRSHSREGNVRKSRQCCLQGCISKVQSQSPLLDKWVSASCPMTFHRDVARRPYGRVWTGKRIQNHNFRWYLMNNYYIQIFFFSLLCFIEIELTYNIV